MSHKSISAFALLLSTSLASTVATPALSQSSMVAVQPVEAARAVEQWERLIATENLSFESYAGFIMQNPGFPQQSRLQRRAEGALDSEPVSQERLIQFFEANPPITNSARARYALALANTRRPEAFEMARAAWRGGSMSSPAEAYLLGLFGSRFSDDDHTARMDALLWQRDAEAATRQIINVPTAQRDLAMARLALIQGETPSAAGLTVPDGASADPGYVYNLARHYRTTRQVNRAASLLANRPEFARLPHNEEALVGEMLRAARSAGSDTAARIASKIDDLFEPGEDISKKSFRLRDDYTSLMWLGGTKALWNLGNGNRAAPLFYRYGAAAQTPQTRSKGFYWAGLASQRAGNTGEAERYWQMAAAYPERFYGQLAINKLGGTMPDLIAAEAPGEPTTEQRVAFNQQPLTNAVRHVARGAPWRTGIRFYRAIAQAADTPEEHQLVAELAIATGRRDLAVNVSEAAGADGLGQLFVAQGFPELPLPQGANFTLTHAIARQESQFAQNAISHAGARGLMQLMPGTAREEARFAGISYMSANLINDAQYNLRLGSNHIDRLMRRYNGSYPLAFAAYNAGPGNVNKWLRRNGDPRTGSISWVEWIEKIPFFETKNYVQRVVENAAVYEHLYPERTVYGQPRMAHEFLR
ncbi:lytic transglycosylase domain-containing protein [Qipengyuania sp. DGS5-3]|uniref:lytic transglycosylase domain-containing protein n=1 Tax=Qipengyuania sp. DGS5-3 TaxID=3349632 RepID=UPI0036D27F48